MARLVDVNPASDSRPIAFAVPCCDGLLFESLAGVALTVGHKDVPRLLLAVVLEGGDAQAVKLLDFRQRELLAAGDLRSGDDDLEAVRHRLLDALDSLVAD